MLYILIAILMFGILIALHEFGHFAAAKLCGVKVNEFSIGMGPQLLHTVKGETAYSLRALPIGGFCAMEGEEAGESADPRAFPNRPWWQRLIILLGGVFMNFLTGFLIILCLYSANAAFYEPVISDFQPGSQAQAQGMQLGDRIYAVNGHRVYLTEDISFFLERQGEARADLTLSRNGKKVELKGFELSKMTDASGVQWLGLGIITTRMENTLPRLLKTAWLKSIDYVRMVWYSLSELVRGAVGVREMSGPVGIVDMVGQVGEQGAEAAQEAGMSRFLGALLNILSFVSFIAINLAVMNLLPIPALDGGQILFMAINGIYAAVTRKKLDPKYLNYVTAAGFACLMGLMLLVTVSDILKKFGV